MYFTWHLALFALVAAAVARVDNFCPVEKPSKGETIASGSMYNMEWKSGASYPGLMNLILMRGNGIDNLEEVGVINTDVAINKMHFKFPVLEKFADEDATYYIKMNYQKDDKVFNYSPPFQIAKSKGGTATTSTSTASATSPTTTSSGSTPTSTDLTTSSPTGAAAQATQAPLALLGVAAICVFTL